MFLASGGPPLVLVGVVHQCNDLTTSNPLQLLRSALERPHMRGAKKCRPIIMAAGGRTEPLANPTRSEFEVPNETVV